MPKYSVSDVIDIIKNLSAEEKLELQKVLPNVLDATANIPASRESHSQIMENINIHGSSGIGVIQAQGGSQVELVNTQTTIQSGDVQAALNLLEKLKQDIAKSSALNPIEKQQLDVPIQTIEKELKKPQPDKNLMGQALEILQKSLSTVANLAEPVTKLAPLVAKFWGA